MQTSGTTSTQSSVSSTEWSTELTTLYRDNFDALVHVALGILRDSSAAEDAVQESFIRFAQADVNPAPGKERAYLRSMVRNEALSTLRRGAAQARAVERLSSNIRATVASAEDGAIAVIESESLADHLNSLSDRQRTTVGLRFVSGLSVAEAAGELHISPGTVKVHTHRASSALRSVLAKAA